MNVSGTSEVVNVVGDHGDAEAIQIQRTSDNLLDVMTADVITALPNANVADVVGRLPGVSLERDEGEGKYVQIRGTEPRLNNTTVDGVELPAPEDNVRQFKLDTIPSGIVESVEVNKTLSANQDADAIGGTVNLVTKKAGESPTLSIEGIGGFTPIVNTRYVGLLTGTVGQRFGANKKFGALFSGSYDSTAAESMISSLSPTWAMPLPFMTAWMSGNTGINANVMALAARLITSSMKARGFIFTISIPISKITGTSGFIP